MKQNLLLATIIGTTICVFSYLLAAANSPLSSPLQLTQTANEGQGGIIGTGLDELRCPKNLEGIGPTWNGVTVGVSSLNDLSEIFSQSETLVTPYPPYTGDFASNYEFGTLEFGTVYACIANNKIAALLINRHAASNSNLPMVMEHWFSFLGEPELISWHQSPNFRVLHWPKYGLSATVYIAEELISSGQLTDYGETEWVYLYPFRGENYAELWPINQIWVIQPFPTEMPEMELEIFDFTAIEMTVTAVEVAWPSITPPPRIVVTPTP